MALKKEADTNPGDGSIKSKSEETILQEQYDSQSNSFLSGSFLSGAVLVALGALFLLNNLGFVDIDFRSILSLWPLLLIAIGVSFLSTKGIISRLISLVVIVILLGILALAALGIIQPDSRVTSSVESQVTSIEQMSESDNPALVRINAGAGKIEVYSDDIDGLLDAHLKSNFTKLRQSNSVINGKQEVVIETEGSAGWWSGSYTNNLFVTLSEALPLNLAIESGASDITVDAADIHMQQLDVDSGASDVDIKLGTKVEEVIVTVDIGMSSITFKVPEDSGVRVEVDSGLSNLEVDGLRRSSDGVYESEGFDEAEDRVIIKGDMGMSNFELERY